MNNIDKYILAKTTKTKDISLTRRNYELPQDSFVFAVQKNEDIHLVQGEGNNFTKAFFEIMQENENKEFFYLKAIKNLLKQKEYLNLLYQVSNDLITDEEFNDELENNEDKYLINIDNILDSTNFKVVSKILDKIGDNFTDDDISEIFSLEVSNIENLLLGNQNRSLK